MKSLSTLTLTFTFTLSLATTAGGGPPTGAYLAWLQANFPAEYGNPALEATVWGDLADPDGDGCPNMLEFLMARDPKTPDDHLGPRVRIEGNDLVVTYRETTMADPGATWLGEWSQGLSGWMPYGVRYQELSTHTGYRMVEARIARNREAAMQFRLRASR